MTASATTTAPTLDDHWNDEADWSFVRSYSKSKNANPGDGGYGAGSIITAGPGGNWCWFYRTNLNPGADCVEFNATGTVVRKSTDRGATWGPVTSVAHTTPDTRWFV